MQALNLILLTAAELGELRQALKLSTRSDASSEDRDLFSALFACWCHNPVATFSLCLLAQAYDVSAELVKEVADVEITVGLLMQVEIMITVFIGGSFVDAKFLSRGDIPYPWLAIFFVQLRVSWLSWSKQLFGAFSLVRNRPLNSRRTLLFLRGDTATSFLGGQACAAFGVPDILAPSTSAFGRRLAVVSCSLEKPLRYPHDSAAGMNEHSIWGGGSRGS